MICSTFKLRLFSISWIQNESTFAIATLYKLAGWPWRGSGHSYEWKTWCALSNTKVIILLSEIHYFPLQLILICTGIHDVRDAASGCCRRLVLLTVIFHRVMNSQNSQSRITVTQLLVTQVSQTAASLVVSCVSSSNRTVYQFLRVTISVSW